MTGRRVPAKRRKFQRKCEVFDEDTFMAKCGTWHRLHEVRIEDGGMHDGVSAAVMLHREDKGAYLHGEARVW